MDVRLQTPFTLMMAGGSGCGKSTLVKKIISQLEAVFDRVPDRILVCYSHMQPLYHEFKKNAPCSVSFIEGLPVDLTPPRNTLLIIDDLQGREAVASVRDWFIKKSHHCDTSVIYLVQNIFDKTPDHRTISLNTHYMVIFKNPRDGSQISHLAKQMFPTNARLMTDAYRQATARPHGYIIVDLRQSMPDHYRLCKGLFPNEGIFAYVAPENIGEKVSLNLTHHDQSGEAS